MPLLPDRIGKALAAVALVGASGLLLWNSLGYYSTGDGHPFFTDKGDVADHALWRAAFYLHVTGALASLLVAPALLWNGYRRRSRGLHRGLGRLYAVLVITASGPAGLYLAGFAKGGVLGQSGFLVLGLAWIGTTLWGWRELRRGRLVGHVAWMLRSYAWALSALFFRLVHVALFLAGCEDGQNYVVSLWGSLAASLLLGEAWAQRSPRWVHSPRVAFLTGATR